MYAFTDNGISHSMFIVTKEGVMVIDPMNDKHAKNMLVEIRNITDAPIKYLFYSHNHWDHISGGQVFRDEGACIISHSIAAKFMKANPNPKVLILSHGIIIFILSNHKVVLPDKVWDGDKYVVSLGGICVELHYLGINHGHGMTTFVVPNLKVGYIADLGNPGAVLFSFLPDSNIDGMLATLEKYAKFDVEKIVFAHSGNADTLEPGSMKDVKAIIQYIKVKSNVMKSSA